MFGGNKDIIKTISNLVEEKFVKLLSENKLNNEQLILTLIWKDNKNLFKPTEDSGGVHLILFRNLS